MSWQARYGTEPPADFPQLETFLNHRSVRQYTDQPVSETVMSGLVAAAQSASTSSNLQLWSIVSVQDPERRKAIAALCDHQQQILDAPWFLCFFADHHRLRYAASLTGEPAEGLGFTEFMLMATIDATLAAERMVCAAESLGLGACYIGALRNDPEGVRNLFDLPDGVFGVFGLCLGYPAGDAKVKPRLSQAAIWFRERYVRDPNIAEYDERMKAFYEKENMRGTRTWSARSGRRVDRHHLTGREVLKSWLEKIGLGVE